MDSAQALESKEKRTGCLAARCSFLNKPVRMWAGAARSIEWVVYRTRFRTDDCLKSYY